ncbi:MAG: hypothetical protein J5833_08070 [Victivallales bacterium]|nr:hypothetical protein [Victivallales bacterium]
MPSAPTNGARIIGSSSAPVRSFLPAKSYLSLIHASGIAMSSESAVVQIAIRKELSRPWR